MTLTYSQELRAFTAYRLTPFNGYGHFAIYTGAMPANTDAASTGTLLAEGANPETDPYPSATYPYQKMTLEPNPPPFYAIATGTPGYWRVFTNSGKTDCIAQGEFGVGKSRQLPAIQAVGQGIQFNPATWFINGPNGPSPANSDTDLDIEWAGAMISAITLFTLMIGFYNVWPKYITFYSGTAPANADAALTGTPLVTFDMPDDWMTDYSAITGKAGLETSVTGTAIASGTATHWRMYAVSDDTEPEVSGLTEHILQGSIGVTGSGADIEMPNVSIQNGQTVTLYQLDFSALGVI